ncbi:hypothetical protein HZA86_03800 [Candidatus Uhrbacteria bacterium]|nr:hypothetical protein [Candidatus Uhrbacteria bacterium]
MERFENKSWAKNYNLKPDPTFNEERMWEEVRQYHQRVLRKSRKRLREAIEKKDEFWIKKWKNIAEAEESQKPEETIYYYLNNFSCCFPGSHRRLPVDSHSQRFEDMIEPRNQLQADLDAVMRKHFDYDQILGLRRRGYELAVLVRERRRDSMTVPMSTLNAQEQEELALIQKKLHEFEVPLFIEMRKLGYARYPDLTG